MADSPDVKKYIDLSVFDEDTVTILNSILATGRGLLPEWQPQVGQIELVLAEAFAVRSAEVVNAINRIPSATTEVLLKLFGIERSDGVKATAILNITFTDSDSIARTLPAGTEFLYVNAVTGVSYIFSLDEDFTLSGTRSGTATVTAQTTGSAYNFSALDYPLSLLSQATYFESASFASSPSGGANAESDEQYFNRGANLLASYTSAATTDTQIKYYTSANKAYANRVGVYNRRRYRDRDTTASDYGFHDGAVLVAVGSSVTNAASAVAELTVAPANLSDLHDSLTARTPSGLTIDVMSAELASVDVEVVVTKKSGYASGALTTAIENAIKGYLDPNTWDWDQMIVRRNEMISLVDSVDGVDYVSTLNMVGKTLIGSDNIGYYDESGGTTSSFTVDISGAAVSTTYAAGAASVFYVDSSSASNTPVVYLFENEEFTTSAGGGATGVTFTAVANGVNYNDVTRSGLVPDGYTGWTPVAGDWIGSTHANIVFANTSVISGGSDDFSTFVPTDSDVDPLRQGGMYLRNLGTLVIYGDISVTVV